MSDTPSTRIRRGLIHHQPLIRQIQIALVHGFREKFFVVLFHLLSAVTVDSQVDSTTAVFDHQSNLRSIERGLVWVCERVG